MLWQESPYDWLEDDGALTAAQLAHAHAAAAPWLDDGIYALLPYSAVLLTAVPAPAEPIVARAMPRSAAAPRCGDNGAVCNPDFAGLHQTPLGQVTLCIATCRSLNDCICLCLAPPKPIVERAMPRSAAASWLRRGDGQLTVQPCPLCNRVNTQ